MTATFLSLEMRTAVRCPDCDRLTPLPGLRSAVTCHHCAAPIDVIELHDNTRDGGATYCFGGYYDAVAEEFVGLECRDARDGHTVPVSLDRAEPTCTACDAGLPIPAAGDTEVVCPGCGDRAAVRWPDEGTRAWDDRLWCVIGDAPDRGAPLADRSSDGSVVPCGRCGGTLEAQGKRRALTCAHCGAVNFLSDAVWTKLFPRPEHHRFYLVYSTAPECALALAIAVERLLGNGDGALYLDKDERQQVLARIEPYRELLRAHRRERALSGDGSGDRTPLDAIATDQQLGDGDAARLDGLLADSDRARLAVVAAPALVVRWARSPVAASRCAAARAGVAESALLTELGRDPDPAVRLAVASRPHLPSALIARFAGDSDPAVRLATAKRDDLAPELLATLRKDAVPEVVAAVKANPRYRPGFLERLFG